MENELTPKIKEWLDTEPEKRDIMAGATLLLQINRNRILYSNIIRNPAKYASVLEYQLNKIYKQRLANITHKEVTAMMAAVDNITKTRGLGGESSTAPRSEWQRGKRADHDELPEEIQQLYVDNADIMRRMREAHTRLRLISPETSTCPDNDRYPIAKYLIELDGCYRENWNKYDHYVKGTSPLSVQTTIDPRTESKNAAKLCTLLLGKYVKTPGDGALADRIKEAYAKVIDPSDTLRTKMRAAGLIECDRLEESHCPAENRQSQ